MAYQGGRLPDGFRGLMVAVLDTTHYQDKGCRVSPHCLPDLDGSGQPIAGTGCPLEQCIYDAPSGPYGLRSYLQGYDDQCRLARSMRAQGSKIAAIALALKKTNRTVYRLLRDAESLEELPA